MSIISSTRFSFYYLEDNDFFIKDFHCTAQFTHPSYESEMLRQEGNIILTTKSIIFEPQDKSTSIIKFHFRYMDDKPKVVLLKGNDYLKLKCHRLIEIPNVISSFISHNIHTDIFILFTYDQLESILQLIYNTYQNYMSVNKSIEMNSDEFLNTIYSYKFDYTRIKSINEQFLIPSEETVRLILPLIELPGLLMITDERVYYQSIFNIETIESKGFSIKLASIRSLYKRTIKLQNSALEIHYFSSSASSILAKLLLFNSTEMRDEVFRLILGKNNEIKVNLNLDELSKLTSLWSDGAISNYEYLLSLNSYANRTRLDLSQYPVFPYIIKDYSSKVFRINDEHTYRNLSLPIGALNPERLKKFKERYDDMQDTKYLYGTHYSNPAYVINYLYRKYPQWMLKLNGGKFEVPDRQFTSLKSDWEINLNDSGSLKELIPEFFETDTSFLYNIKKLSFGIRSTGEEISDVTLPDWSTDAYDFLRKNRLALESTYTNENIHLWIDLIFGYKQQGKSALEANNVFHYLSYQGNADLTKVVSFQERKLIESQVSEFGITPLQIFKSAHPKRFANCIKRHISYFDELLEKEDKIDLRVVKSEEVNQISNINIPHDGNSLDKQSPSDKEINIYNEEMRDLTAAFPSDFKLLTKTKNSASVNCIDIYESHIAFTTSKGILSAYSLNNSNNINLINYTQVSSQKSLTSLRYLNHNLLTCGDIEGSVSIFNTQHNKFLTSITAHSDKISNIFSIDGFLITISDDCLIKKFPLNSNLKCPSYLYHDIYEKPISSDFNIRTNNLVVLESNGLMHLIDVKAEKRISKIMYDSSSFNYIKFNPVKDSEFYLCTDESFKLFDIRKLTSSICDIDYFYNTYNIFNSKDKYMLFDHYSAFVYNNNFEMEKNFMFSSGVMCSSHSYLTKHRHSESTLEVIGVGCEDGAVYISSNRQ